MLKKITSLANLKQESKEGGNFFIPLLNNARVPVKIRWDASKKLFFVEFFMDDTIQRLTEMQMMDTDYSTVGYAMTKGALFKD